MIVKNALGWDVSKIDKAKYIRQLRIVVKWWQNRGVGTAECATGFGKSAIGLLQIYRLRRKLAKQGKVPTVLIVVPTKELKVQWEAHIKAQEWDYIDVMVINTAIAENRTYNLVILDEIHKYASEQFINVFTHVKRNWVSGLTATLHRLDDKHKLLEKLCPVIATVTEEECVRKAWISDLIAINLAVDISGAERAQLETLDKAIRSGLSQFGDYKVMQTCKKISNAVAYATLHYPSQDPNDKGKALMISAINTDKMIRRRTEFLYKTSHKIEVAIELAKRIKLKTIMFGESTSFADEVAKALGRRCRVYHSNLPSQQRVVSVEKHYKTLSAAEKFAKSVNGTLEGLTVKYNKTMIMSGDKLKKEAITLYKSNVIDTILTAKALDAGFDVTDVELGIEGSRTRAKTQHSQRKGRVSRSYVYQDGTVKRGAYISLFIPDTQDEKWLKEAQDGKKVLTMYSVDEVVNFLANALQGINVT